MVNQNKEVLSFHLRYIVPGYFIEAARCVHMEMWIVATLNPCGILLV